MNLAASPTFRLSQTHLNLLAVCPLKFQQTYLEQLAAPSDPEQQERMSQGSRFHLLMQQWQLGLPVESIVQSDPQLQQWFHAFTGAAIKILQLDDHSTPITQSEHSRTLEFEGYLLTVVYDVLLLGDRQAKILDWKTYPRPRRIDWLLQNWQTRLYRFVLAETSGYAPEQISMVYWFFQSSGRATTPEAQSVRLSYDRTQHERTRQDLTVLLHQLTQWLEQYHQGEAFPQVGLEAPACESCSFVVRCDRPGDLNLPNPSALPNFADIQEVPL